MPLLSDWPERWHNQNRQAYSSQIIYRQQPAIFPAHIESGFPSFREYHQTLIAKTRGIHSTGFNFLHNYLLLRKC